MKELAIIERQTNYLNSAVLMPKELIKKEFFKRLRRKNIPLLPMKEEKYMIYVLKDLAKGFDKAACEELSKMLNFKFTPIDNKFRGLSSKDAVSMYHSSLKVLAEGLMKIVNDIR